MTRVQGIAPASLAVLALTMTVVCLGALGPDGTQEPARASGAGPPGTVVAARSTSRVAGALLRIQNATRGRRGLRPLAMSRDLTRAARRHARDMIRRHYFGHVSHGGRDVVDRVAATNYGRTRFVVQENLYWWNSEQSPAAVVKAWMASAVHRANVLHRGWHQFGTAVVMRSPFGRRGMTVVGVYGTHSAG